METMEALHQIQSFPSHHSMMQSGTVGPPTGQGLSAGQYVNVPNFYSTTSQENIDTILAESQKVKTEEGKDNDAKDSDKNGDHNSDPNIDIYISNVVCTFSVRCHLNLKRIGMEGINVEYKRESGKVLMKMRNPHCTATIWSSGKITITGNSSESDAKVSARRIARRLQRLGFRVHYHQFQVVNVLGTCRLPFAIRISKFSEQHPRTASYEPEIHPAVTYKIKSPKATLKIFSTGSITVTAPSVENISHAIHHIYPLVEPFQMVRIEKKQPERKPSDERKRQSEAKKKWPEDSEERQELETMVKQKQDILRVGGDGNGDEEEAEEEDLEEDPLDDDEEWESELSDDDL